MGTEQTNGHKPSWKRDVPGSQGAVQRKQQGELRGWFDHGPAGKGLKDFLPDTGVNPDVPDFELPAARMKPVRKAS